MHFNERSRIPLAPNAPFQYPLASFSALIPWFHARHYSQSLSLAPPITYPPPSPDEATRARHLTRGRRGNLNIARPTGCVAFTCPRLC